MLLTSESIIEKKIKNFEQYLPASVSKHAPDINRVLSHLGNIILKIY